MNRSGKNILSLLLLLSLPILGLDAKKATHTKIPGIDTLPAAKSGNEANEKNSNTFQGQKAPNRNNKKVNTIVENQDNKKVNLGDISLPIISNIKTSDYPSRPNSIKIEWNVSQKNATVIYVARYIRPVSSREFVLDADVVSSPPLDPKATSFIDYNIPDGTYYYVVVTSYEMSAQERLKLVSGQNYSTNPSVIYRSAPKTQTAQPGYFINGLYAVNLPNAVLLNWAPANAPNIKYKIYKSFLPLTQYKDLEFAKMIGEVDYKTLKFTDTEPIQNRVTYYLVSVVDMATNKEHALFQLNKTLVQNSFAKINISSDRLKYIPSSLTTYIQSRNSIQLLWIDSRVRIPEYSIYRSNRPITGVDAFRNAKLVGHVPYGTKSFQESGLKPGIYYYAVLPKKSKNKLIGIFVPDRTFTSLPIKLSGSKKNTGDSNNNNKNNTDTTGNTENTGNNNTNIINQNHALNVKISLFGAKRVSKKSIKLSWSIKYKNENSKNIDFHFLLYRSTSPLTSFDQVQKNGDFITELGGHERSFRDNIQKNNRYYYALLLDFDGKISQSMLIGRNYLRRPIVIDSNKANIDTQSEVTKNATNKSNRIKKPHFTMADLNRVLAKTYHKNRFSSAIREIAIYRNSLHAPLKVRAKASLYTGMSWYQLGRYRAAMEYFLESKVRTYYPERSRFWYKRSIEKTG